MIICCSILQHSLLSVIFLTLESHSRCCPQFLNNFQNKNNECNEKEKSVDQTEIPKVTWIGVLNFGMIIVDSF